MAANSSDWLSQIDDEVLMSSLTIPGTHDSSAYTYKVPFIATQRLDVQSQLNAGIRYLDLRCGLQGDVLVMVHGPTTLGLRLEDILQVVYDWLVKHPTEALIVQMKKDRDDEKSSLDFSQAVVDLISSQPTFWRTANTTPHLGELRGKIQLFRRFRGPSISNFGLNVSRWQDNPLKPFTMRLGHGILVSVQDHYRYNEPVALPQLVEQKCTEIEQLITRARSNADRAHWYINFTSALEFNWSYRYAPQDIAEGSWYAFNRVRGVNETLAQTLNSKRPQRLGIVAMDFPSDALITALIASNATGTESQRKRLQGAIVVVLLLCILVHILCRHCAIKDMLDISWLRQVLTDGS